MDDVRQKISLNAEQKIGLKYYDQFRQKMPRSEVEEIFHVVKESVEKIIPGFIYEICGSYRRGREMCGDADILMTHPNGRSHDHIVYPLITHLHEIGKKSERTLQILENPIWVLDRLVLENVAVL